VRQRTRALTEEITERERLERELLEISEREQRRISQDLHDSLCQHLTGTTLAGQVLEEKLAVLNLPLAADAGNMVELVEQGIDLSRKLAKGLYPVEMAADGLMLALEEYAATPLKKGKDMSQWFWYAVGAAVLYGLHQVFTKLASSSISDGLGGFVVEGSAALTILVYLGWLWFSGHWDQKADAAGVGWSSVTGLCVGVGTILFFLLFQKGGPLSAVPMVLAAWRWSVSNEEALPFRA
jgi:transporter family protein